MQHDDKLTNRAPLHQLSIVVLFNPPDDLQHTSSVDQFDQFLVHCQVQLKDMQQFCQSAHISKFHIAKDRVEVEFSLLDDCSLERGKCLLLHCLECIGFELVSTILFLEDLSDVSQLFVVLRDPSSSFHHEVCVLLHIKHLLNAVT